MRRLLRDRDRGATAIEYGLILGLVAVVIIVAVALLGQSTQTLFNKSQSSVSWAATQGG